MGSGAAALVLAINALYEAQENLEGLPATEEVQALFDQWCTLRSVLHGLIVMRVVAITAEQESRLVERVIQFARRVSEVRGRVKGG